MNYRFLFIILSVFIFGIFLPKVGLASSLSLSPASGAHSVGDTFDVSLLLDTQGKSINALKIILSFPSDKLQIVSPSTGSSIVGVWTVPPKFNNVAGTISLEGGIPKGIVTSRGVLTTFTFRVKSVGNAMIRFLPGSGVFLNDGFATDDLDETRNAVYELRLPPPGGPIVTSDTHIDQSTWYRNNEVLLRFGADIDGAENLSYVLNNDPGTIPDSIGEGFRRAVSYTNLTDGVHYFHVKMLRDGVWGGTTHFAVKIDTTPPAEFPIEVSPNERTTATEPVIKFWTTDTNSGIDHYEIKLEPVSSGAVFEYRDEVSFFIEATSPFIPATLALGSYDVFVKAFDKAGNVQESKERLEIVTPYFRFIGEKGVIVMDLFTIPWLLFWFISIIVFLVLVYIAHRVWHWHHEITIMNEEKKLSPQVQNKLAELKEYTKKYGLKIVILIFGTLSLFSPALVTQAETIELSPPYINTISKDISNKDIFYVGGKTDISRGVVILYLQNLITAETTSEEIFADQSGDWFYRHHTFLAPGDYLIWAQSRQAEELSPPGPQTLLSVKKTAIEFGANRLSYEAIYLFLVVLLLSGIGGLLFFIVHHAHHGRKKHKEFKEEVKKVEEYIKVGFAMLARDLKAELDLLHNKKMAGNISREEEEKEAQLLRDLENVSHRLMREMENIEKIEQEEDIGR